MAQLREHDFRVAREDLPVGGGLQPAVAAFEEGQSEGRFDVLNALVTVG